MADINTEKIIVNETRIANLRKYLFSIIDTLLTDSTYQINANMLDKDINNYSLDKIPVESNMFTDILGNQICRDVFSFRSRNNYNQDTINNLLNIGFFEMFEEIINSNNDEGILPDITGIESIECLNAGTLNSVEDDTAEFEIQLQITYKKIIKG